MKVTREYLTYDKDEEREAPIHQRLDRDVAHCVSLYDARRHYQEDPSTVEFGQSEPYIDTRFHETSALPRGDLRRKLQKNQRRFPLPIPATGRSNDSDEYYTN